MPTHTPTHPPPTNHQRVNEVYENLCQLSFNYILHQSMQLKLLHAIWCIWCVFQQKQNCSKIACKWNRCIGRAISLIFNTVKILGETLPWDFSWQISPFPQQAHMLTPMMDMWCNQHVCSAQLVCKVRHVGACISQRKRGEEACLFHISFTYIGK